MRMIRGKIQNSVAWYRLLIKVGIVVELKQVLHSLGYLNWPTLKFGIDKQVTQVTTYSWELQS